MRNNQGCKAALKMKGSHVRRKMGGLGAVIGSLLTAITENRAFDVQL